MKPTLLKWAFLIVAAPIGSSLAQSASEYALSGRPVNGIKEYGRPPLTFEANRGQTSSEVKFLSQGPGYTAFLTAGGMVLSLHPQNVAAASGFPGGSAAATVQFILVGAAKNPIVFGEDPQLGKVNYFFGSDPSQWRTNVPTYGKVRYRNIYPGIDLVYYGNHRQMEYDFELQPGADPRRVQFEIRGASQIKLDASGNVVLQVGSREVQFQSPLVYQNRNGERILVNGKYAMTDATHIAFELDHYDGTKPLVIDPVLVYSTYLGGSGTDQATGIAIDGAGSVYVAGYTNSVDFPLTTLGTLSQNANHVFVAKLDPAGANLIYADYLGGNSQDYGFALALDSSNEVYVTGSTASSNFPLVSPYQSWPGFYNAFLAKISADGSSLLYSTYLGGNCTDQPSAVAIDGSSNVLIAGSTCSTNFPVANPYQPAAAPSQGGLYGTYGFVTKFTPDGASLVYSTYLGGSFVSPSSCGGTPCYGDPYSGIQGLALDGSGNAYVTGSTDTYNFPTTPGAYSTTDTAQPYTFLAFVTKFSSSGVLDYSTYFYDPYGIADPKSIAVDSAGSAYITGVAFSQITFPITSTGICDPAVYGLSCSYAFVTKFDPTASTLVYSTFLGPNNWAVPTAIALDANNDAYVLANTSSNSFGLVNGIESYAGGNDALVVEIDPVAGSELFATYLGGSGNETPSGMVVDAANNIYVTGSTNSSDFPVTQGSFQASLASGNSSAFITKIGEGSIPAVSLTPSTLNYSPQNIGSTSQPLQVQFRNLSSLPLAITSISVGGDYAETDNCGTSLAAASGCSLSVTFTPTSAGNRAGSILIKDSAIGSPHVVTLSGTGLGAVVALSPASLSYAAQQVGVSSAAQPVTLANEGNASLNIGNIQLTGDYAQSNNCPASLAAGSNCTFNVAFTPTAAGSRAGTLSISDSAAGSPHTVALSGTGLDFTVTASPNNATVTAGGTATYTVTVSPLGGSFANSITVTCGGTPAYSTCNPSPTSITPGSTSSTVTVTIRTTAASAEAMQPLPSRQQQLVAIWMQLQGFGLFGLMVVGSQLRNKKSARSFLLLVSVAALLFLSACAGGTGIGTQKQHGTAPGTYTLTVTGTSGALAHSLPLTLTVE